MIGIRKRFELSAEKVQPAAMRDPVCFVHAEPGALQHVQRRKPHACMLDRLMWQHRKVAKLVYEKNIEFVCLKIYIDQDFKADAC